MKIIIPMAGMGKRMRPHTLTIPKPLISLAGKSIVQRLVEEIAGVIHDKIDEIGFIIGDFGRETEEELLSIAARTGAKGRIFYQHEPLGTAHAILCAGEMLSDKIIVAYADTLFKADFEMDDSKDGIIWVQKVNNPESFGVVELNQDGNIMAFHEKPKQFISDMAIIGIYYFRDGDYLKNELQYLIDKGIKTGGEFGITDALQNMMNKGTRFSTDTVTEWLDCGNKDATVYTHQRILEYHRNEKLIAGNVEIYHSIIIEPCYIGPNAKLLNSVIGPYVSIGEDSIIDHCVIENSVIQKHTSMKNVVVNNSMVGHHVDIHRNPEDFSVGDFNQIR